MGISTRPNTNAIQLVMLVAHDCRHSPKPIHTLRLCRMLKPSAHGTSPVLSVAVSPTPQTPHTPTPTHVLAVCHPHRSLPFSCGAPALRASHVVRLHRYHLRTRFALCSVRGLRAKAPRSGVACVLRHALALSGAAVYRV